MHDYEIRINYEDDTFEVVTVLAWSLDSAVSRALTQNPDAVSATVLCSIDRRTQPIALAF